MLFPSPTTASEAVAPAQGAHNRFSQDEAVLWEQHLEYLTGALLRTAKVDEAIRSALDSLLERFLSLSSDEAHEMDPRLFLLVSQGAVSASLALTLADPEMSRRVLRDAVSQMRQALRDNRERTDLPPDSDPQEQLRWLRSQLEVSDSELASLVGLQERTLQRWMSPVGTSNPRNTETLYRLRLLVRITGALRHVFTGAGVAQWLRRPNPSLRDRAPVEMLQDPECRLALISVANDARSGGAA